MLRLCLHRFSAGTLLQRHADSEVRLVGDSNLPVGMNVSGNQTQSSIGSVVEKKWMDGWIWTLYLLMIYTWKSHNSNSQQVKIIGANYSISTTLQGQSIGKHSSSNGASP